jgi:hypothetical protein
VDFLLLWAGGVFVFFSLADSKLGTYLLPMFPALALLTGHAWLELFRAPALRRGFLLSLLPLVAAFPLGLVVMLIHPLTALRTEAGIDLPRFNGMLLCASLILGLCLVLFLRQRYRGAFAAIVGMVAFALFYLQVLVAPAVNEYRSGKELVLRVDAELGPHQFLVFFRRMMDSALFYTDRKVYVVHHPWHLQNHLTSDQRVFALTNEKYLPELEHLAEFASVVDRVGCNVVLSNRRSP